MKAVLIAVVLIVVLVLVDGLALVDGPARQRRRAQARRSAEAVRGELVVTGVHAPKVVAGARFPCEVRPSDPAVIRVYVRPGAPFERFENGRPVTG